MALSQTKSAKQLPLFQKVLIRKGILSSKPWGPFLCTLGLQPRKGLSRLRVEWLIQGHGWMWCLLVCSH